MSIAEQIRTYIRANMLYGDESVQLDDEASLLGAGIVDSTGVVELVMFVENHFGVSVDSTELLPSNFDSVSRLAAYVARKGADASA